MHLSEKQIAKHQRTAPPTASTLRPLRPLYGPTGPYRHAPPQKIYSHPADNSHRQTPRLVTQNCRLPQCRFHTSRNCSDLHGLHVVHPPSHSPIPARTGRATAVYSSTAIRSGGWRHLLDRHAVACCAYCVHIHAELHEIGRRRQYLDLDLANDTVRPHPQQHVRGGNYSTAGVMSSGAAVCLTPVSATAVFPEIGAGVAWVLPHPHVDMSPEIWTCRAPPLQQAHSDH